MEKYVVIEKAVGETPLSCAEAYRTTHPELAGVPMAYAGRLDPMASGKLLVLLGDECKVQERYHGLDKEYEFSVLFGIGSDTHDVLGRLEVPGSIAQTGRPSDGAPLAAKPCLTPSEGRPVLDSLCTTLIGPIELPYPHFSAKTVKGKPLHQWTLERRLDEIEIPTNRSVIFELELTGLEAKQRAQVCAEALAKIETIPPVTDPRKALGNDFRRADIREDWALVKADDSLSHELTIAHFRCVASSGTYMRSLAHLIGQKLGTGGLAWRIHRTMIGTYNENTRSFERVF